MGSRTVRQSEAGHWKEAGEMIIRRRDLDDRYAPGRCVQVWPETLTADEATTARGDYRHARRHGDSIADARAFALRWARAAQICRHRATFGPAATPHGLHPVEVEIL